MAEETLTLHGRIEERQKSVHLGVGDTNQLKSFPGVFARRKTPAPFVSTVNLFRYSSTPLSVYCCSTWGGSDRDTPHPRRLSGRYKLSTSSLQSFTPTHSVSLSYYGIGYSPKSLQEECKRKRRKVFVRSKSEPSKNTKDPLCITNSWIWHQGPQSGFLKKTQTAQSYSNFMRSPYLRKRDHGSNNSVTIGVLQSRHKVEAWLKSISP